MRKIFSFVLGLIILGLLASGAWEVITLYIGLLKTLDKQVAAAIIAASTTVIVSVASLILARYFENRRLIEKDIRDKKTIVYEKLIKYFFQYMGVKDKSKLQSMEDFYIEFAPSFITWGSDEVLKHWSDFRRLAAANDPPSMLGSFEKLLLIIRKDIGHKNTGLGDQVLLSTFVNDLDKIKPK